MRGLEIHQATPAVPSGTSAEEGIRLLSKCLEFEVMEQSIIKGAVVWLSPADDPNALEFFYILSGQLTMQPNDETLILSAGDSFTLKNLEKEFLVKATASTRLLYVSNRPMFDDARDFETYLKTMLDKIDDKDHYTCQHSKNVMKYTLRLSEAMLSKKDPSYSAILNDMIIAALFHDVGKCYVPDEILKKNDQLEPEEIKVIRHHPVESGRLLRKFYGDRVAEIAENHHERLDGSGYPFGLSADEISAEAKILAVADAFDAMTTNRGYNSLKSFHEAASELVSMPEQYDHSIAMMLLKLVEDGELSEKEVQPIDKG